MTSGLAEALTVARLSLIDRFARFPEPRKRVGRIRPIPGIQSLATIALLAGMRSLKAIDPFGRGHGKTLPPALGFTRARRRPGLPSARCSGPLISTPPRPPCWPG